MNRPHAYKYNLLKLNGFIFVLYTLSLCFDFRRAQGDEDLTVIALSLGNVILGLYVLISQKKISRKCVNFLLPFLIFLVSSAIVGLYRDQDIYSVLSHAMPVVIFIISTSVIANSTKHIPDGDLIKIILFASAVSLVWKVIFGFIYYGLNLDDVRYQIISGSVPLVFAYGVAGTLAEKRNFTYFSLSSALLVILISVTRTYILVAILSFLIILVSIPKVKFKRNVKNMRKFFTFTIFFIFIVTAIEPGFALRWLTRLVAPEDLGFDLTGLTRIAEIRYQLNQLSSDSLALLFGFGHAARTEFYGSDAVIIEKVLGHNAGDYSGVGYGHNFYIGLIYVGGLLFGGSVIISFIYLLMIARQRLLNSWNRMDIWQRFLLAWGLSGLTGYLAFGFLGGNFGDRSNSYFQGISAGMIIRALSQQRLINAHQENRTVPSIHEN